MHKANLTIITIIPVVLLAATVAISVIVSEDVFARNGRYDTGDSTSQAAAVGNDCLNPIFDSNTIDNAVGIGNCGGTVSQQDESGSASAPITHQDANPTIELQRSQPSETPPPQEPSPTGTVTLIISLQCGGEGCPTVDQLSFAVSTNIVSPTQFSPEVSPTTFPNAGQTLTFNTPSTFEVTLLDVITSDITTDAPCSTGDDANSFTGPIPSAGETISCNIAISIVPVG